MTHKATNMRELIVETARIAADVHCPTCGAITHRERDDEGDEVLICSNDDCPHIVVAVISRRTAW